MTPTPNNKKTLAEEFEKRPYYKVVSDEYPKAVFFLALSDALYESKCIRENGDKAYTRRVMVTEDFIRSLPEL